MLVIDVYFSTLLLILTCFARQTLSSSSQYPRCVLSADFGTESCRVGLFDLESGVLIATSAVPYPTSFPANGFAEQNPLDWWKSFTSACHNIHDNLTGRQLLGISVDTTACSVVSLDENFE